MSVLKRTEVFLQQFESRFPFANKCPINSLIFPLNQGYHIIKITANENDTNDKLQTFQ